jgi:hypothetical protein
MKTSRVKDSPAAVWPTIYMTGTVTRIEWMNPHAYLYLDVADEETGEVETWAVELGSPNGLRRVGWQRTSVNVGDVLTVEGTLGRFKANLANARAAILARTGERLGAASSEGGR